MLKYVSKVQVLLISGDIVIILISLFLVPILRFGVLPETFMILDWPDMFFALVVLFIFYLADLYDPEFITNKARTFIRIVFSSMAAFFLTTSCFYILKIRPLGTATLAMNIAFITILAFLWRWTITIWTFRVRQPENIAILGKDKAGMELASMVQGNRNFAFVGFVDDLIKEKDPEHPSNFKALPSLIYGRNIHNLVVTKAIHLKRNLIKELTPLKMAGFSVYELPVFYEINFRRIPVHHIDESWFVFSRITGVARTLYNTKLKRLADTAISLILLIPLAPLSLLIAAAIKVDSRGPVLFIQPRIGLNGRPFNLYKFRTMVVGEEKNREHAGSHDDPRITRVGKALRLFRLDEIPQLWNVLKGDMSLIGPRALMEEEVRVFEKTVPYFQLRHSVRPGISGWAQINYPHGVTVEDAIRKLEYDLYYIKHLSPALDFLIFIKTLNVVLFRKGAR